MTKGDSVNSQVERLHQAVRSAGSLQPVLIPFYALVLSVGIGGVLIFSVGVNPFEAYWALLRGMFGSGDHVAASMARSVPYVGSALAMAFAFRAGFFNIGAEGQILAGGIMAAWVGTWAWVAGVPSFLAVMLMILAGLVGGAAWGFIPGALRATTGAHEVITTIMLNSIILFLVRWLINSRDPVLLKDTGATVPRTETIASNATFPEFVSSEPNLHFGLVLLVAACVVAWVVLKFTSFGFELHTLGSNVHAALYAGMNVKRLTMMAMAISGGWAGLSGASEVAGTNQFFQPGTFMNMGFDGIAIALLAKANPIAIIPAAFLWGSMLSGAPLMQAEAGVSIDVVRIIQALVVLFIAADAIVRYVFRVKDADPAGFGSAATGWDA